MFNARNLEIKELSNGNIIVDHQSAIYNFAAIPVFLALPWPRHIGRFYPKCFFEQSAVIPEINKPVES